MASAECRRWWRPGPAPARTARAQNRRVALAGQYRREFAASRASGEIFKEAEHSFYSRIRKDEEENRRQHAEENRHDRQRDKNDLLAAIDFGEATIFRLLRAQEHPLHRPEHVAGGENH